MLYNNDSVNKFVFSFSIMIGCCCYHDCLFQQRAFCLTFNYFDYNIRPSFSLGQLFSLVWCFATFILLTAVSQWIFEWLSRNESHSLCELCLHLRHKWNIQCLALYFFSGSKEMMKTNSWHSSEIVWICSQPQMLQTRQSPAARSPLNLRDRHWCLLNKRYYSLLL